jgi:hypothetical protein
MENFNVEELEQRPELAGCHWHTDSGDVHCNPE